MKLVVHTARGTITSKVITDASREQSEELVDLIKKIATNTCDYFTFDGEHSKIFIGKDLLTAAVFEIEN